MVRFCSIFSQVLQLISRQGFQKAVDDTKAERHARGFRCWDQFVAMLFCQLGRAQSLREICGGLTSCEGRLGHLGAKAPGRSTLAYANAHRPAALFEKVFYQLLDQCQSVAWPRKFRFKNKLMSLDSTIIEVCQDIFKWAKYQRTKGAIKLHFTLDHDGYLPTVMVMTDGNTADGRIARRWTFSAGTILVFDRGYRNTDWYRELTASGVFFVTKLLVNAVLEVVERHPVPQNRRIVSDETVRFVGKKTRDKYPGPLRRIIVDLGDGETLALLTNNFHLGASTIATIYKDRWQIELFFKALKQNLRIKTFVGTSANALKIQIWTALIAILLLKYMQMKARFGLSLSNLVALLRMNLFVYRDLWDWVNNPFSGPPREPSPVQMNFSFN
jgi:hypothetical protein